MKKNGRRQGAVARKDSAKRARATKKTGAGAQNVAREASFHVDLTQLAGWRAQFPTPTATQRAGYTLQYDDSWCEKRGGQTRAPLVLREAWQWTRKAAPVLL